MMEAVMFAVPAAGVGMIAAGIALGVKPVRADAPVRRLVKRSDIDAVPHAGKTARWPFGRRRSPPVRLPRPPAIEEAVGDPGSREVCEDGDGTSISAPAASEPVAWYHKLDPAASERDTQARCALAESLGSVRARWAGTFLRDALGVETEPAVRARMIAALFRAEHLEPHEVFLTALARGGVERAVVLERLTLLGELPAWAVPFIDVTVDDADHLRLGCIDADRVKAS